MFNSVTLAFGVLALHGQEDGLDVGQHAALGDGHVGQQHVKLPGADTLVVVVLPARSIEAK